MASLEQEILDKFHQLDKEARQRVRQMLDQEIAAAEQSDPGRFDYEAWFRDIETLRQEIQVSQGTGQTPLDMVDLLRKIRDGEDE